MIIRFMITNRRIHCWITVGFVTQKKLVKFTLKKYYNLLTKWKTWKFFKIIILHSFFSSYYIATLLSSLFAVSPRCATSHIYLILHHKDFSPTSELKPTTSCSLIWTSALDHSATLPSLMQWQKKGVLKPLYQN